jgi:hypothetical protein
MTVVMDAVFMSLLTPHPTINHSAVSDRSLKTFLWVGAFVKTVFALILVKKGDVTSGIQYTKDAESQLLRALLSETNATTYQYYIEYQYRIKECWEGCLSGSKKASMTTFCHGPVAKGITKNQFSVRLIVGF